VSSVRSLKKLELGVSLFAPSECRLFAPQKLELIYLECHCSLRRSVVRLLRKKIELIY
jgi:hypothetical protein